MEDVHIMKYFLKITLWLLERIIITRERNVYFQSYWVILGYRFYKHDLKAYIVIFERDNVLYGMN